MPPHFSQLIPSSGGGMGAVEGVAAVVASVLMGAGAAEGAAAGMAAVRVGAKVGLGLSLTVAVGVDSGRRGKSCAVTSFSNSILYFLSRTSTAMGQFLHASAFGRC